MSWSKLAQKWRGYVENNKIKGWHTATGSDLKYPENNSDKWHIVICI